MKIVRRLSSRRSSPTRWPPRPSGSRPGVCAGAGRQVGEGHRESVPVALLVEQRKGAPVEQGELREAVPVRGRSVTSRVRKHHFSAVLASWRRSRRRRCRSAHRGRSGSFSRRRGPAVGWTVSFRSPSRASASAEPSAARNAFSTARLSWVMRSSPGRGSMRSQRPQKASASSRDHDAQSSARCRFLWSVACESPASGRGRSVVEGSARP